MAIEPLKSDDSSLQGQLIRPVLVPPQLSPAEVLDLYETASKRLNRTGEVNRTSLSWEHLYIETVVAKEARDDWKYPELKILSQAATQIDWLLDREPRDLGVEDVACLAQLTQHSYKAFADQDTSSVEIYGAGFRIAGYDQNRNSRLDSLSGFVVQKDGRWVPLAELIAESGGLELTDIPLKAISLVRFSSLPAIEVTKSRDPIKPQTNANWFRSERQTHPMTRNAQLALAALLDTFLNYANRLQASGDLALADIHQLEVVSFSSTVSHLSPPFLAAHKILDLAEPELIQPVAADLSSKTRYGALHLAPVDQLNDQVKEYLKREGEKTFHKKKGMSNSPEHAAKVVALHISDKIETDNPRLGDLTEAGQVLKRHHLLAAKYDVKDPYWNFTSDSQPFPIGFYESYSRGPFDIFLGKIEAFSVEYMAILVDCFINSYLKEKTFGPDYPYDDQLMVERTTALMIDGYNPNRLIISLKDRSNPFVVGGCVAVPGEHDLPISLLVGRPEASLPTLSAVKFNPIFDYHVDSEPEIAKGDRDTGFRFRGSVEQMKVMTGRENQFVCFSRYHRLPDQTIMEMHPEFLQLDKKGFNDYRRSFGMETLSGMARTANYWAQEKTGRSLLYGLLDTHDPNIVKVLTQFYGGTVWVKDPQAADALQNPQHPLHYHYKAPDITLVTFDFANQLKIAQQIDQDLGSKSVVNL